MDEHGGTWIRPRGQAWGNESQRAVLRAVAEDVVRRSDHRVAAIEVLRSDGILEFVAIAGSPEAEARLLGRGTPLSLGSFVSYGTHLSGWIVIPGEDLDDDARAWMSEYGHTPDLEASAEPDAWRPDDRLLRLLENEDGELRAILYLDEPRSGRRPTADSLAATNAEIEVLFAAVVSIVERELFGEQVRMLSQARTAMQAVRPGRAVDDFLTEMSHAMADAMSVDTVDVLLAGQAAPLLEPHTPFLEEHMRQVWLRRGHLVLERDLAWGVTEQAVPTPEVMRKAMARRGLGSWLLIPIGVGDDYLGTMGLGRAEDGPRWIDSEINAATVVASDVARVVLDARLIEREHTLNQELRVITDYRRDMVVTLAHELRNPVSVLRTHLELLAEDPACGTCGDSLGAMDRASRRIADMIEDLMALATVSDPDRSMPQEPVDLSALVRESGDFLSAVAAGAGIDLVVAADDDLVVAGDATGLQRMATNLLSNAIKYTPAGGHVTLSLARVAAGGRDGVQLVCTDDGIGIDASELEQVFTPFFRSSSAEARRRTGTGLGLAITERVVQRHQGTVEVRSEVGVGTAFTVWLPLVATADAGDH